MTNNINLVALILFSIEFKKHFTAPQQEPNAARLRGEGTHVLVDTAHQPANRIRDAEGVGQKAGTRI